MDGQPIHYDSYPNTPCGTPACRASIVTEEAQKITCKPCRMALKLAPLSTTKYY